jgi:hypothetical protein
MGSGRPPTDRASLGSPKRADHPVPAKIRSRVAIERPPRRAGAGRSSIQTGLGRSGSGRRPSSSRTIWRIARSSRSSESMVSMSRTRGAWIRAAPIALRGPEHPARAEVTPRISGA